MFSLCKNFPEHIKTAVVNYYAKHICGAVSVCLKQKDKKAYNLCKTTLVAAVKEIKPYKKVLKKSYRLRAFFFARTPDLYWVLFHGARRLYYLKTR